MNKKTTVQVTCDVLRERGLKYLMPDDDETIAEILRRLDNLPHITKKPEKDKKRLFFNNLLTSTKRKKSELKTRKKEYEVVVRSTRLLTYYELTS